MKVKMLVSIAGHADAEHGLDRDFSFAAGKVAELPDPLAVKWVSGGLAVPIEAPSAPKKAAR